MHSTVLPGVGVYIKCELIALVVSRLGSLDARASDSGLAWTARSTDRLPRRTVGSFSLLFGVGLNIDEIESN